MLETTQKKIISIFKNQVMVVATSTLANEIYENEGKKKKKYK